MGRTQIRAPAFMYLDQQWVRRREKCQVTAKPETIAKPAPDPAVETTGSAISGLFDFGTPAATRKRLFQFAKRSRKTALGPSRSEFGCD